jgi:hypothetical protein
MQVTLIFYLFYLEGHITRKLTLKNKKKSMDKKLDTPSTLRYGLRRLLLPSSGQWKFEKMKR